MSLGDYGVVWARELWKDIRKEFKIDTPLPDSVARGFREFFDLPGVDIGAPGALFGRVPPLDDQSPEDYALMLLDLARYELDKKK